MAAWGIPSAKDIVLLYFLGWIMALGDGVRITGPGPVVKRMKAEVRRLNAQYGD